MFNTEGHSNSWWIYNTLLSQLDEPIYVLTCDNVVELDFDLLEHNYEECGRPACLLVPVRPVPGLEGDYIFHESHVVTRLDRHTPSDIYCSGIQILNPREVNRLTTERGDFYGVWSQLIAQRKLLVSSVYPKTWISVDTVEQLAQLESDRRVDERRVGERRGAGVARTAAGGTREDASEHASEDAER